MTRAINFSVARLAALALTSVIALAGCGGGAETTETPVTSGPIAGPTYSGPAPATADIQAFRINFWENVRGSNRCGRRRQRQSAQGGEAARSARLGRAIGARP